MPEVTPAPNPDPFAQLAAWRTAHPQATFAELEAAVETQLDGLRAQFLTQAAPVPPEATAAAVRPRCPTCATPMQRRGERERQLTVAGGQTVTLRRPYYCCLACAGGLFPPR